MMSLLQELLSTQLEYHDELNPKLWARVGDTYELKQDVAAALNKIADTFAETLGVDSRFITDIVLTGSNANFNWTPMSDIDIHLEVDLVNLECDDCNLDVDGCMQAKKTVWNLSHDVTVNGFPVEVYVADNKEDIVGSAAVYSLKDGAWLQEPDPANKRASAAYPAELVSTKAEALAFEIDQAIASHADDPQALKDLNIKLAKMRQAGLARAGELSLENVIFKALRNNGYVQKLRAQINQADDRSLSLGESLNTKVAYEVTHATANAFEARAEIGDRGISFNAQTVDGEEPDVWEVEFSEHATLKTKVIKLNQRYTKTGSGNELEVFSFVLAALREFVERYSPAKVLFTSEKADENRTSLYMRLAKRFKLSGYEVASISTIGDADQFEIVRR